MTDVFIENSFFQNTSALETFVQVTSTLSLLITNSIVKSFNKYKANGGCFLKSTNIAFRTFSNFTIQNAYSDKTTAGLKIFDGSLMFEMFSIYHPESFFVCIYFFNKKKKKIDKYINNFD